jgi:hypothetical protein
MGMGPKELSEEHQLFLNHVQAGPYLTDAGTVAVLMMLIARLDDTNAELQALRKRLEF